MTSREVVARTIKFEDPNRIPYDFPDPYGSDFVFAGLEPSPDARPANGPDEWGAVWKNIGASYHGEVKEYPLREWSDLDRLVIPDVNAPHRWENLNGIRERAGDKFLLGFGLSIYERVHFLRGLENTWADIYENPDHLQRLIDILVGMNLQVIERYADLGVDGYFFGDDWGLQDRLMIAPEKWRELWKPAYARVFEAAHAAGMFTLLHSCGYIVDILDDLIEVGLDVIHMDQQENMGLELLRDRFRGRITFFSPVDIQNTMARGNPDEIRAYCRKMASCLGTNKGGFIPGWYSDPVGAGHTREAVDTMCREFLKISEEFASAQAVEGGHITCS
ncbi:MAG: uroporphyrinogen decarboxylase family protein [Armatimonadota bacterium]